MKKDFTTFPKWGEAVKAVVVAKEEGLMEQAVIDFCDGKMANYKKPKSVDFVEEILRNPSGKILKNDLRERYQERE